MGIIQKLLVGFICLGSIAIIVLFVLAAVDALINTFF